MSVAQRFIRCRRCGHLFPTRATPGNTARCSGCGYPQRTPPAEQQAAAKVIPIRPAAGTWDPPADSRTDRVPEWSPPSEPRPAEPAGSPCPSCGAQMRVSPRGTTWRCACGQIAAPAGVLAIYRSEGQPRQARTAAEQFAADWELATRQDAMHEGLDSLIASGRLRAGSMREKLLRARISDAKTLRQLEDAGRAMLSAGVGQAAAAPPVVAGQVIREPAAAPERLPARSGGQDGEDARRTEWSAFLRREAARTGYFSDGPRPALPAAPGPGDLVPARRVTAASRTGEACRLCRKDQAAVCAERGEPDPGLLAATRDGTALHALCGSCCAWLQGAYPGYWVITRLAA